jgi:hypothetical protein
MANIVPPPASGFVANPNLILPTYILTEVVRIQDQAGNLMVVRRPRPLSIIVGAQVVLQCDRQQLAR